MLHESRQEWLRSSLLNVSKLGGSSQPLTHNESSDLSMQRVATHEVIPYMLVSGVRQRTRKIFQARTPQRREWEITARNIRQERLLASVRREHQMNNSLVISNDVTRVMGIFHVQAMILQPLARRHNILLETSPCGEKDTFRAGQERTQAQLNDATTAIANLWN